MFFQLRHARLLSSTGLNPSQFVRHDRSARVLKYVDDHDPMQTHSSFYFVTILWPRFSVFSDKGMQCKQPQITSTLFRLLPLVRFCLSKTLLSSHLPAGIADRHFSVAVAANLHSVRKFPVDSGSDSIFKRVMSIWSYGSLSDSATCLPRVVARARFSSAIIVTASRSTSSTMSALSRRS